MLPPFDAYCHLLADLPQQFQYIQQSTLSAHTIGALTAEVEKQITFSNGYVLDVWELLDLSRHTIHHYSYELRRANETLL